MASLKPETWAYIKDNDEFNGVEVSNFNNALLMSLLEESHGEEYNDEQLNRVIQSLEAEIYEQNMSEDIDQDMEWPEFSAHKEDGQNCLASMEFEWPDNMELVPSSPNDDMKWNINHCCGYELDNFVEYEGASEYSQIYNIPPFEEQGFSYLWQEPYDIVTSN